MMGQNKNLQAPCMPPRRVLDLECGHAWAPLLAVKLFLAAESEQNMARGAAWPRSSMPFAMAHHSRCAFLPGCCPSTGLYLLSWLMDPRSWRVGA